MLGHRVSQHDFFARLRDMCNTLPRCWVDTCMIPSSSTRVVELFAELNAKWDGFFGKFDLWVGCVEEPGSQKKVLEPVEQWDRVTDMYADVERFLSTRQERPEYLDAWLKWWLGR